jgi:hypothetical protein
VRSLCEGEAVFEGLQQPLRVLLLAGITLPVFGSKKLPELGKVNR